MSRLFLSNSCHSDDYILPAPTFFGYGRVFHQKLWVETPSLKDGFILGMYCSRLRGGLWPTRDDGDINPNTKAGEISPRGRKITLTGKRWWGNGIYIPWIKNHKEILRREFRYIKTALASGVSLWSEHLCRKTPCGWRQLLWSRKPKSWVLGIPDIYVGEDVN